MKSRTTLAVRHWRVHDEIGGIRITAHVGDTEVWFRLPRGRLLAERGDSFLAVALMFAMALDANLDLRDLPPVSPLLLESLETIQDIWTIWNPRLHRVAVWAHAAPPETMLPGEALFFSGGVDGLITAIERRSSVSTLLFLNGFDFDMTPDQFATATRRVMQSSERLGVPLLTMETNWIELTRQHRIARSTSHGGCLVAAAHLLAPAAMTIASSNAFSRLTPWGSHPLLDPRWSTEATTIVHHGCHASRAEKLADLAEYPEFLADLWVCHTDATRNCGRCTKCLRTQATLEILDVDAGAFPRHYQDPIAVFLAQPMDTSQVVFLPEIRALAEARGKHDIARQFRVREREMARRALARRIDAAFFGGAISRRWRRGEVPSDLRPWGDGPRLEA